jgi:hypothetical protein
MPLSYRSMPHTVKVHVTKPTTQQPTDDDGTRQPAQQVFRVPVIAPEPSLMAESRRNHGCADPVILTEDGKMAPAALPLGAPAGI